MSFAERQEWFIETLTLVSARNGYWSAEGELGRTIIITPEQQRYPLIAQADAAMARGDIRQAESLLELAAQRGRDAATLLRLATVRRVLGDYAGALKCASAAIELEPRNSLMCLMLGSLREATGAIHGSQRAYRAACASAPRDLSFQPAIAKQLDRARAHVEAAEIWRRRLLDWDSGAAGLKPEEQRRMRAFRGNLLENLDAGPLAPPVYLIPGLKPKRYFDAGSFAGISELEATTDEISEEFLALAEEKKDQLGARLTGLHGDAGSFGSGGRWSMIPLIRNGRIVEEYASRCPRTMELADGLDLPRLSLISPSLYFSVLEPGSRIAPHTGITNARLIAHLPLIVPENCGFRVGGETRQWQRGKALVFDDMTEHEAWNNSDRIRVVLIADLWRPELGTAERQAVRDLMNCPDIDLEITAHRATDIPRD